MSLEKLKDSEYQKSASLLAELIELNAETEEKIYKCFQNMGIKNFFIHLELVDLSPETFEKMKSIKSIIEILGEERGLV